MKASPTGRGLQNRPDAGDALLDPLVLAALALLLVNDHVLKAAWPGPISGKLSDLAGLVFFPILLVSGAELILALGGRWRGPTVRALAVTITLSAAGFILIKTARAQAGAWRGSTQAARSSSPRSSTGRSPGGASRSSATGRGGAQRPA